MAAQVAGQTSRVGDAPTAVATTASVSVNVNISDTLTNPSALNVVPIPPINLYGQGAQVAVSGAAASQAGTSQGAGYTQTHPPPNS